MVASSEESAGNDNVAALQNTAQPNNGNPGFIFK
jgi:hypothetical protein